MCRSKRPLRRRSSRWGQRTNSRSLQPLLLYANKLLAVCAVPARVLLRAVLTSILPHPPAISIATLGRRTNGTFVTTHSYSALTPSARKVFPLTPRKKRAHVAFLRGDHPKKCRCSVRRSAVFCSSAVPLVYTVRATLVQSERAHGYRARWRHLIAAELEVAWQCACADIRQLRARRRLVWDAHLANASTR